MPIGLLILLIALATYRATRFVTCDSFPPVRWARRRAVTRGPEWLADLVTCPWCASAYVGAAVVWATDLATSVPLPGLVWAGALVVAGLLGECDDCE